MRCLSCNDALSDYDCSRKTESGHYVDLCQRCFDTIKNELFAVGNFRLRHESEEEVLEEYNSENKRLDSDTYIDYNNDIDKEY